MAHAVVLRPASGDGPTMLDGLAAAGDQRPLVSLASALVASPPAQTMPGVVLGVRERPQPLLVFAGDMDRAARARIADLDGLLREAANRLRIITWHQVEAAVVRLADQVTQRLGDETSACVIVGIPRGGLVVAGLLAYALGLPGSRVRDPHAGETAIVVDDCALSGVRLREYLATSPAQRIVVATLCSHPDLRAAVEREERVAGCTSGFDLRDHASAILGDDADAWRRRWERRVPGRYHTALLDLPVFPWSEPEVRLWNGLTGEVEPHWWLGPPSSCLHHRVAPAAIPLQIADDRPGIERLSDSVVPITHDDQVALIDTAHDHGVTLDGVGAELWEAWMADGAEGAVATVAQRYGQPVERVAGDLDRLLTSLVERGLLRSERSIEAEGSLP